MDMLNGNLIMNGAYNTANPAKPSADLNLRVTDIDIHSAYNAFLFHQTEPADCHELQR